MIAPLHFIGGTGSMRIIMAFALGLMLAGCTAPEKPNTASGPAPLPAHPVGDVSKTALPPVAAEPSASAKSCTSSSAQGRCN